MRQRHVSRILLAFAIAFAAAPFAFALIRAVTTGNDLRYIWVAAAALLGAAVVRTVGAAYGSRPRRAVAVAVGTLVLSTACAVLAAVLLGTRLGAGIMVVGISFGICCAAGSLFHTLAGEDR